MPRSKASKKELAWIITKHREHAQGFRYVGMDTVAGLLDTQLGMLLSAFGYDEELPAIDIEGSRDSDSIEQIIQESLALHESSWED